ncbi:hypothetical protein F5Y09DRAFT_309916 [Xylaria sp. FL1042]|nr:hypothetical protein F5Y09DRAFT_309916 [Xylaria sp. FL1042]
MLLAAGAIGEHTALELRNTMEQHNQRFMAATAYPYYNLENARLEPGVSLQRLPISPSASLRQFPPSR